MVAFNTYQISLSASVNILLVALPNSMTFLSLGLVAIEIIEPVAFNQY